MQWQQAISSARVQQNMPLASCPTSTLLKPYDTLCATGLQSFSLLPVEPCAAHVDLRDTNVMWKLHDGEFLIKFVDYDWAGTITGDHATTLRYPSYVSVGVYPSWVASRAVVNRGSDEEMIMSWVV